jgi:hypothetical protein
LEVRGVLNDDTQKVKWLPISEPGVRKRGQAILQRESSSL